MPKKRSGSLKRASPSCSRKIVINFNNRFRSIVFAVCCFSSSTAAYAQISHIEQHVLEEFTEDRTSGQTHFFQGISNSVNYVSIGLPASLLLAGVITHDAGMKKKALYVAESAVVSGIITFGLKYSFQRTRPFVTDPHIIAAAKGASPSFPSGHTSAAFSAATSVSLAYPKWYVVIPSFAYASTVGYSRMYLGVHYPTDVVVGALVGSASAWITWKANKWINRRRQAALLPAN